MADFNSIRLGASDDGKTWSNVNGGTALSATTKFHQVVVEGTSADTLNLEAGNGYWANVGDVSNGTTTYAVYQNTTMNSQVIVDKTVVVNNKDSSPAGETVIPLGPNGNLIAPVQVEGKWYYYWDKSGNGTAGTEDQMTHDTLDAIFRYDINGIINPLANTNTNSVYRYSYINGIQLALPTLNGDVKFVWNGNNVQGTAYADGGATSNGTFSTEYDELLAIIDAYNGTTLGFNARSSALQTKWGPAYIWAADDAVPDVNYHANVYTDGSYMNYGGANHLDAMLNIAALQVVGANTAPVLNAAASPTLTGVSSSAAAPVNGSTTGSDLVSSLVAGITDADSGALKGIAVTGVGTGGTLYYSLDGGTTWLTPSTTLSNTNALLLAADNNTRVFYRPNGTNGTITDAITFRAWDQTQNITEGVFVNTFSQGGKAQFSTATDTVSVFSSLPTGNSLDLGTVSGLRLNLINKVTGTDGKVYYFVDRNADGSSGGADGVNHNLIDTVFNGGVDTTGTSGAQTAGVDTERSVIVNGYTLVLPTVAELMSASYTWPTTTNGTGWTNIFDYWTADVWTTAGSHYAVNWNKVGSPDIHADGNDQALVVQVLVPVAPVVMDLNRDGFMSYGQVTMDVNGDRILDTTRWAGAQDGVLVWDKFADGLVHDNSQYAFGQYATKFSVDAQGFARLASDLEGLADAFDTNRDGVFSMSDEKFGEFKIWQDVDQDGVSDAGEVRSLADWGLTSINLVSDGVQRTPVAGVTEAGRSAANLADGSTMLVADAAFNFRDATADELAAHAVKSSASSDEWQNKPYELSAEEMAQLGLAEAGVASMIEAMSEVSSELPTAPAVCTTAAESSTYSLSNGQSLDLTTVLKDMSYNGIVKGLEQVDMSTDTGANVVSLSLADVLSMPPIDGVYKLVLSGAANDKVMLTEGEWTDTGAVVDQGGHSYAVYTGTNDSSAQLLIDQQMLQSQHNG
jgi:hypothetical protein